MGTLAEVIAMVRSIQGQIDDQLSRIASFKSSNAENINRVQAALAGGARGHDRKMSAALSQAEEQLSQTETVLVAASESLTVVASI